MTTAAPGAGLRHPLRGLLVAHALGTFNDNAWRMLVAFLALRALREAGAAGAALEAAAQTRTTIAFLIFTLPLMLFSLPSGTLADRLSKRSVIVAAKALEILIMVAGTAALLIDPRGWVLPVAVLGLIGVQAALLGPAKYGILPEILPHDRLSSGNALLEMWGFLGIIAGTASGGLLLQAVGESTWIAGALLTVLAVAGCAAAFAIPRVAPSRGEGGIGATVTAASSALRADRVLRLAVFGSVFFWSAGSLLSQNILVYEKATLGVSDVQAGIPLAAFGIGIGAGSLLAARLSGAKVEYGLIPLGAFAFALFTLVLGAQAPGFAGTAALTACLGIASGFLLVPINALIQWRSPGNRRGAVIALSNTFVFGGTLAGSLAAQALSSAGLSPRGILLGAGVATVAGTLWALRLLPDALLRLLLILLTHTFYRLMVVGRVHVPQRGAALLVPNHVSFVDGLFLIAALDRRVRFIVESGYFHHPIMRPFMKSLGAIPISGEGGPRAILRALRDAGRHLDEGRVVCIFAEGQITRTGLLLPFRRGMERIVKDRPVPIVPVHLDRVWGSIFSRAGGRFLFKIPERVPYRVTVSFGAPLPATTPVHEVRRAVQDLGEAAWTHRKIDRRPLHHQAIRCARRRPRGFAMADVTRPRVGRIRMVAGAIAFARALRRSWEGQERVGILLPPSVAGALVNFAAALAGRASVNLNYTAGPAAMRSAASQAGLKTVVTSRAFLEKAGPGLPGGLALPEGIAPIWIEDVAAGIGGTARLLALVLALGAPVRLIERLCGAGRPAAIDDVLTVIFSSGSTGDPKGVPITHFNLDANLQGVNQVFRLGAGDRVLGILPLFHSFGTLVLWLAFTTRVGVVFHPNPLDGAAVGALVQRYRVTFLVATPTFLNLYMRRCTPAQFGSLRIVLTGAEKLPERVALAFEDAFGIRPLEGYGATECSPVIAVSTLDYRAPGFYQPGSRRGFVGQPLPGVTVRIVDPDTFAPLPAGASGLLLVRGPNVMRGYLGRDDLTAQALRDGWYVTGDIAHLDEDGFVRITDRLARFSKIGGEMVPHGRVEEALHQAADTREQVFAVTAVPDERKGERLAVLHTLDPATLPAVLEKVARDGLPNLFLPRLDHFVKVERIPLLGTGKVDLREVRRIAAASLRAPG